MSESSEFPQAAKVLGIPSSKVIFASIAARPVTVTSPAKSILNKKVLMFYLVVAGCILCVLSYKNTQNNRNANR